MKKEIEAFVNAAKEAYTSIIENKACCLQG